MEFGLALYLVAKMMLQLAVQVRQIVIARGRCFISSKQKGHFVHRFLTDLATCANHAQNAGTPEIYGQQLIVSPYPTASHTFDPLSWQSRTVLLCLRPRAAQQLRSDEILKAARPSNKARPPSAPRSFHDRSK